MTSTRARLESVLTALAGWPRRLAASVCLVAAAFSALGTAGRPGPSRLAAVVVAGRPLAAGTLLTTGDLTVARWPASNVPTAMLGRVSDAVGRRVAAALARGEPVSTGSLLEPAIARALAAGRVATTVALADANQAAILHPGALVDLYPESNEAVLAAGKPVSDTTSAGPIVRNVEVLAVLPASPATDQHLGPQGSLGLIVAVDPGTAGRLATQLSAAFLATLTPPS